MDKELLEDLVLDNDLDRLKALTSGFNIFESIGAVRREVRHSDFLSFLLNPSENHGLYDSFLKSFLFSVTKFNKVSCSLSPIDIDLMDLAEIEIRREWENIDILFLSEKEKFICAIENKVDSSEHSNQLIRYESIIDVNFTGYKKLLIFLTLDCENPEDNQRWMVFCYRQIHEILTSILNKTSSNMGHDISILLRHYSEMINRHLMSENEIAELSRKIYQRHKRALDIIFEHKPDALNETNAYIVELLEKIMPQRGMVFDHSSKSYVRFSVKHWDYVDECLSGDGQWTKSNRVLLFEIANNSNEISLKLVIGPGKKELREKIFNATEAEKVFKGRSKSLYVKWTQIYKKTLVSKKNMEQDLEHIKGLILQELNDFFYNGDSEKIVKYIDNIFEK
jgi:Fe-S cluster biosynthesis and repair protein YggX